MDLTELGVADHIVEEPLGGAHRDRITTIQSVGATIQTMLDELKDMDGPALVKDRREKFLAMGTKGLAA